MRQSLKHQAWIILAASLAMFINLGTSRLWDVDEPRNATCAAEMLSRGDWIEPTFNGKLRTDKPILLYWFLLPAYKLLGVTELAARLTSAIFGVGTVLLTYHLGRRLFDPAAGLWAGLLLSSSVMFVAASRWATPDSLLIFFSTLALWFFVRGSYAADANPAGGIVGLPRHASNYWQMYLAMALAVLAKGPVGLVVPLAIVGLYLLVLNPVAVPSRRPAGGRIDAWRQALSFSWRWLAGTFRPSRVARFAWQLRPLTMLAILGAVALPWYVAVGIKTGGKWPLGFLWDHNVERFLQPKEGHSGPPFFHLFSIAAGFFPASVFLVPTGIYVARRLRSDHPWRRGHLLAICWIAVYLVLFSLAATKLPNYVTPVFPAIALLTGTLFSEWQTRSDGVSRRWQTVALTVFGFAGAGLAMGVPLWIRRSLPGEGALGLVGLIPIGGAALCLVLSSRQNIRAAALTFVACGTLFTSTLFGWALVRVNRFQNAVPIAELIDENSPGKHRIATYKVLQPSWVFYARQPIIELEADRPEIVRRLFAEAQPTYLITEKKSLEALRPYLPPDVRELGCYRRFLQQGEIVVLGRLRGTPDAGSLHTAAIGDFSRIR